MSAPTHFRVRRRATQRGRPPSTSTPRNLGPPERTSRGQRRTCLSEPAFSRPLNSNTPPAPRPGPSELPKEPDEPGTSLTMTYTLRVTGALRGRRTREEESCCRDHDASAPDAIV